MISPQRRRRRSAKKTSGHSGECPHCQANWQQHRPPVRQPTYVLHVRKSNHLLHDSAKGHVCDEPHSTQPSLLAVGDAVTHCFDRRSPFRALRSKQRASGMIAEGKFSPDEGRVWPRCRVLCSSMCETRHLAQIRETV